MPRIEDIAKITGYSIMTVSRVINCPDKVSNEARKIIQEKLEELRYIPNIPAVSLASNRTYIIYLQLPDETESLQPNILRGVASLGEELGKHYYSLQISRKPYRKDIAADGIIALNIPEKAQQPLSEIKDKPVILFGENKKFNNTIGADYYSGSRVMCEYVIQKGHKNTAYINYDNKTAASTERLKGHLDCMIKHGESAPVMFTTRNSEISGYNAAAALLKTGNFDALICASDLLALGVMRYATENKINIPGQLAVSGFDGNGFERLISHGLTTIEFPAIDAAKALAKRMIDILSGKADTSKKFRRLINPVLKDNGSV